MTDFNTYTLENAPDKARDVLETVNKAYGFVPNMLGTMAEAPTLVEAYLAAGKALAKSSLSDVEQQVVFLTISRANGCEYCVSAHSTIAGMHEVPQDAVEAIRDDRPIDDARLEAIRKLTIALYDKRGWLSDDDIESFLGAGFERQQLLEVILGVGMKTWSNYVNHIAGTELDEAFRKTAWKAPKNRVA
ncbi:MAG: carboxymuconolactone decarboxylase family protein [Woeseiaceae bacterium]|nr:carboxymuconolactone decarboxylase family protein [Woeseiaceae bacterium]